MPSARLPLFGYPRSYADAARILGRRESRSIGNHTDLVWEPGGGMLSVKFGSQTIVRWSVPDERHLQCVYLYNEGRWTLPVQQRIAACLPEGWTLTGEYSATRWHEPAGGWELANEAQRVRVPFYPGIYLQLARVPWPTTPERVMA